MEDESAYFQPMSTDDQVFMMPPSETPQFYYGETEEAQYLGDMDTSASAYGNPEVTTNETAAIILAPPSAVVLAEPEAGDALSPMAKWNNEWMVVLKERKDEENKKTTEDAEKARIELEAFEKERVARIEGKQKKNRTDEHDNLEAAKSDLASDNSWQKVVKMVDLTHDEKASDCGRMRDILISLKNDTVRGTALA
jgi:hypothetical protein